MARGRWSASVCAIRWQIAKSRIQRLRFIVESFSRINVLFKQLGIAIANKT